MRINRAQWGSAESRWGSMSSIGGHWSSVEIIGTQWESLRLNKA